MSRALFVTALLVLAPAGPARASAEPVLVLDGERVERRSERFEGASELARPSASGVLRPKARAAAVRGRPTREALSALASSGQIDQATYDARLDSLARALRAYRGLSGVARTEMAGAIANADAVAAGGALTPSRLAPVFLTLDRNSEWWEAGTVPSPGQRIEFEGSELVWQYYRGQGIQLQMLANFAKANALASARRRSRLRALLGELVPLASDRGGVLAWEYFFRFGGGDPPWSSGISQGTAVQALGRAAALLEDPALFEVGERALALFEQPPPSGVRVDTADGAFYLIYTFAPDLLVLNSHLQSVIGLHDFAGSSGSPRAQALFSAGLSEARAAVPRYDTGKWSLYSLTRESDLGYHELVTTFLEGLCSRLGEPVFCDTAARFEGYKSVPPALSLNTRRIRAGRRARIGFSLDKISRVRLVVTDRRGRTVLSLAAVVGRGTRYFTWSRPRRPGLYRASVTAVDLAGNAAAPVTRSLRVLPPRRGRRR